LPRNSGNPPEEGGAFVSVAEAQRRFLTGQMSRKWWYRMAHSGQIVHHRVGDTILFRSEDIERFIARSRRAEEFKPVEAQPAMPLPPAPEPSQRKRRGEDGFFRIFPKR